MKIDTGITIQGDVEHAVIEQANKMAEEMLDHGCEHIDRFVALVGHEIEITLKTDKGYKGVHIAIKA